MHCLRCLHRGGTSLDVTQLILDCACSTVPCGGNCIFWSERQVPKHSAGINCGGGMTGHLISWLDMHANSKFRRHSSIFYGSSLSVFPRTEAYLQASTFKHWGLYINWTNYYKPGLKKHRSPGFYSRHIAIQLLSDVHGLKGVYPMCVIKGIVHCQINFIVTSWCALILNHAMGTQLLQ